MSMYRPLCRTVTCWCPLLRHASPCDGTRDPGSSLTAVTSHKGYSFRAPDSLFVLFFILFSLLWCWNQTKGLELNLNSLCNLVSPQTWCGRLKFDSLTGRNTILYTRQGGAHSACKGQKQADIRIQASRDTWVPGQLALNSKSLQQTDRQTHMCTHIHTHTHKKKVLKFRLILPDTKDHVLSTVPLILSLLTDHRLQDGSPLVSPIW